MTPKSGNPWDDEPIQVHAELTDEYPELKIPEDSKRSEKSWEIERMLIQGKSVAQIAEKLKVGVSTVRNTITEIKKGWLEVDGVDVYQKRAEAIRQYQFQQSELWDLYNDTKDPKEKKELMRDIRDLVDRCVELSGSNQIAKQQLTPGRMLPGAKNATVEPMSRVERNLILDGIRANRRARDRDKK